MYLNTLELKAMVWTLPSYSLCYIKSSMLELFHCPNNYGLHCTLCLFEMWTSITTSQNGSISEERKSNWITIFTQNIDSNIKNDFSDSGLPLVRIKPVNMVTFPPLVH